MAFSCQHFSLCYGTAVDAVRDGRAHLWWLVLSELGRVRENGQEDENKRRTDTDEGRLQPILQVTQ